MSLIALKQVPFIETYYHRFQRKDGTFFEVETNEADYRQLRKKNPINPTHPDGKWVCSRSSGGISVNENGEYALDGKGGVIIKLDGDILCISESSISNKLLTAKGLDEVNWGRERFLNKSKLLWQ